MYSMNQRQVQQNTSTRRGIGENNRTARLRQKYGGIIANTARIKRARVLAQLNGYTN